MHRYLLLLLLVFSVGGCVNHETEELPYAQDGSYVDDRIEMSMELRFPTPYEERVCQTNVTGPGKCMIIQTSLAHYGLDSIVFGPRNLFVDDRAVDARHWEYYTGASTWPATKPPPYSLPPSTSGQALAFFRFTPHDGPHDALVEGTYFYAVPGQPRAPGEVHEGIQLRTYLPCERLWTDRGKCD